MNCPDAEAWLAFYGGETDEAATERMAGHLQECLPCQEEFDRLSRFGAGLRGALRVPAVKPRAIRRRLIRPRSSSWLPLAVAAGLAVAALGLLFTKPSRPPEEIPVAHTSDIPEVQTIETPPAPVPPTVQKEPPSAEFERPAPVPPTLKPEEPAPVEPAPLPPAPTEPGTTRAAATAVAIATLERIGGSQPLLEGQGANGRAVVKFHDGTRMDLGEKTVIARISDRAGAGGVGNWVELTQGTVTIEAPHQPADRAMTVATPHGEARIVGTTLRLAVEKESTRLEVVEGRVRLTRPGGGSADVIGGHFAVAAEGVELAARPLPKMVAETPIRFTFEDGRMPKGLEAGSVERGPERAGSRYCVAGAMLPGATSGGHVKLSADDAKGLFAYSDDLVLSFDYWADDSVRTLDLHMWSRVQQTTFGMTVWNTPREQWTHQVIPLTDFVRTEPDRLLHMKPGEAVPNLWIQAGQVGGKLYLDNLEIVRLRPSPPRKKP
jgi:ferric-dicitrate binding protein FerR (iron transport regulator)